MTPPVYRLQVADWNDLATVARRFVAFLEATPLLEGIAGEPLAAVKLTFGEAGNQGHPPAVLVRSLVDVLRRRGARPFLTETNTLYHGRRRDTLSHLELAREHGFTPETIGAPILFGDGLLGRDEQTVALPGPRVRTAHLSPVVRDADLLVGLAHVTGHLLTGFGGALKNVGMGLASRAGKLAMHAVVSPTVDPARCTLCRRCLRVCVAGAITAGEQAATIDRDRCTGCAECLAVCPEGAIRIDWSNDTARVQEMIAEYALGVWRGLDGPVIFVNLLNHVSKHCDCIGATPETIAPDLGLLASADPVALDQASLDWVRAATGRDPFRESWPEADPEVQLLHAEAIGLGRREYRIEEPATA